MNVVSIPVTKIFIKDNSRINIKDSQMASLMTSIKQNGLLQPIGVQKEGNNGYSVVYGHRRFIAHQKLGIKSIDSVVLDDSSEVDIMFFNLVENSQRTSITAFDKGRYFDGLVGNHNLTIAEISARTGESKKTIQIAMDVFKRIPLKYKNAIKKDSEDGKVKDGKISLSVVSKIASMRRTMRLSRDQTEQLMDHCVHNNLSVSKINELGRLMRDGYSISHAMRLSGKTVIVNVPVVIKKDLKVKIEQRYKMNASKWLSEEIKKAKILQKEESQSEVINNISNMPMQLS